MLKSSECDPIRTNARLEVDTQRSIKERPGCLNLSPTGDTPAQLTVNSHHCEYKKIVLTSKIVL